MKIKFLGEKSVGGKKFDGVVGGFGQGKRSILVRDVAQILGTNVKSINQSINRNRQRFINKVDLIDLKSSPKFEKSLADLDFTPREIANANNIYLLSERGLAKLLKIMDSDRAWAIYENLVDEYFILKARRPLTEYQRQKIQEKQEEQAIKKAKLLLAAADKATTSDMKLQLLYQAQALLTGQAPLAIAPREDHFASAAAVAKRLNVLGENEKPSGNEVMRIAYKTKIVAPKGCENQYGRWDMGNWTFTEKGVAMIEKWQVEKDM